MPTRAAIEDFLEQKRIGASRDPKRQATQACDPLTDQRTRGGRRAGRPGGAITVAMAALAALAAVARRRSRSWGASDKEIRRRMPGDGLVPEPAGQTTHAVTIHAPAEEVWPWLVQIGRGRAGMYGYDGLENLVGLDIQSADAIHPEWQHLAPGDRVEVVRKGWCGLAAGYSFPVAQVEAGRTILLRQQPPEHPWNAVWSLTIVPKGHQRCRLVSRSRATRPAGALRVATALLDPITMLMTRKMLLGIKERAERRHRAWDTAPPAHLVRAS
ncbi:MAG: hypothetical protein JWM05_3454 [Acidimicrobiales bacterium]|nr:hypothetical protein [Acidimicrobiales bacterium]